MEETSDQLLARLRLNGNVRQHEQLISVYDVMRRAGVRRDASSAWNLCLPFVNFPWSHHQFCGAGQRQTPCVDVQYLRTLLY